MKKLVLLSIICFVAFFLFVNFSFSPNPKATKKTQIRIFTINKGKMNEFVSAWKKGVLPLRTRSGFKIEGAWVVQEKNKFIWILSYDGPEGFEAGEMEGAGIQGVRRLESVLEPVQDGFPPEPAVPDGIHIHFRTPEFRSLRTGGAPWAALAGHDHAFRRGEFQVVPCPEP